MVSIRNNANHANKTQHLYCTTVIEQGSGLMARNHYIDEILQPVVVPYIQTMEPGALLQDDNARPHRVRIVDAYLQQQHITRIDWPACSPDLNPIEHLWDQLGRAVQACLNVNSTRADLRTFLVKEWDRLPQDNVQRLVHSMRRRCAACIAVRGGPTHYWCNESIKWLWSPLRVFHPECFKNDKVPLLGPYPPVHIPLRGH